MGEPKKPEHDWNAHQTEAPETPPPMPPIRDQFTIATRKLVDIALLHYRQNKDEPTWNGRIESEMMSTERDQQDVSVKLIIQDHSRYANWLEAQRALHAPVTWWERFTGWFHREPPPATADDDEDYEEMGYE